MTFISNTYKTSIIKSAEDVNSKSTNTGTGWVGSTWTGSGEIPLRDFIRFSMISDVGGTVFFEFGYDGGTWVSTFPVSGFDLGTFHEYHGADLGGRAFRVRVVFDSLPTSVTMLTIYSDNAPALNSPLSQGISGDQDATTVKAVLHGEVKTDPGNFVQQKFTIDGAAIVSADSSLINFSYDSYNKVSVSTTVDRFDYFVGGLAGTKVADIAITYEDTSKLNAVSAVRTNV